MEFAGNKLNLTPGEMAQVIGGHLGNYLKDLHSGKFNYSNQEGMQSFPGSKWNYSNMGKAITEEKAAELQRISDMLGLPIQRGTGLE